MDAKNDIIKIVNENLLKNSGFEFISVLEDITLSDIDYIERLSVFNNKSSLTYQIVDNTYIKINCSI